MKTEELDSATAVDGPETAVGGRARAFDVVGLLARLVLGGALLYAGVTKIGLPEASANAVRAYQILPYELAGYVGYALPVIEIIIGGLLVVGLFTRVAAGIGLALMVVFVAGIAQAWARGLSIDCGCFGGGGAVAPDQTQYPADIARDAGLALCGMWLTVRPDNLASLDRMLFGR